MDSTRNSRNTLAGKINSLEQVSLESKHVTEKVTVEQKTYKHLLPCVFIIYNLYSSRHEERHVTFWGSMDYV